jgi:hypothetical protein
LKEEVYLLVAFLLYPAALVVIFGLIYIYSITFSAFENHVPFLTAFTGWSLGASLIRNIVIRNISPMIISGLVGVVGYLFGAYLNTVPPALEGHEFIANTILVLASYGVLGFSGFAIFDNTITGHPCVYDKTVEYDPTIDIKETGFSYIIDSSIIKPPVHFGEVQSFFSTISFKGHSLKPFTRFLYIISLVITSVLVASLYAPEGSFQLSVSYYFLVIFVSGIVGAFCVLHKGYTVIICEKKVFIREISWFGVIRSADIDIDRVSECKVGASYRMGNRDEGDRIVFFTRAGQYYAKFYEEGREKPFYTFVWMEDGTDAVIMRKLMELFAKN